MAETSYRPHQGKFGIVTGGSRGIGEAISENLASKGCNLLLVFTSEGSKQRTQTLCSKLSHEHKIHCSSVQADLSEPSQAVPQILSAAQERFKTISSSSPSASFQIDILINNAGIAGNKYLNDTSLGPIESTQFHKQYNVNVLAPLLLTQACAPYLPADRSGRIVNVSSVSSSLGCEGQSIYAGTKAALEAMTRVWARELAERATVNAINPGPVYGDMYSQAGKEFWDVNQKYVDAAPLMEYKGGDAKLKDRVKNGDLAEFDRMVLEDMGGRRPAFTEEIAGVVDVYCLELDPGD
ncbi:putative 3-oxoacyl-(acyl-carrier-protein) reductase [Phaeomoniella chlamydospora]|uniref:Putative 3-oxoacyl-(Acyl-carrier-protein) reductase n=1 Tax=Phaeomoniella chlamydospora TaxID=158046 RepID=A0A0G2E4B7_PHACM|nr:putative 3-oxoacyl-(acyl-carrier-protein) reductase [Phaeomoniella chlamydospora]